MLPSWSSVMRPVGFGLAKKAPLNQKEVHAFVANAFWIRACEAEIRLKTVSQNIWTVRQKV
jgi:hypothetical protein